MINIWWNDENQTLRLQRYWAIHRRYSSFTAVGTLQTSARPVQRRSDEQHFVYRYTGGGDVHDGDNNENNFTRRRVGMPNVYKYIIYFIYFPQIRTGKFAMHVLTLNVVVNTMQVLKRHRRLPGKHIFMFVRRTRYYFIRQQLDDMRLR